MDYSRRIGGKSTKGQRPIVAKFQHNKERELVTNTSFAKKEHLKNLKAGVGAQLTRATVERRRELQPIFNREKKVGKMVKWVGDQLFVQDKAGDDFKEVTR